MDRGGRVYRRAGRGAHVDFAAPGVAVWTAAWVRGARPKTGTSFATPFVTAAVVLAQRGLGLEGQAAVRLIATAGSVAGAPQEPGKGLRVDVRA